MDVELFMEDKPENETEEVTLIVEEQVVVATSLFVSTNGKVIGWCGS